MAKPLDGLLQKEMTRKEFLAAMGLGIGSILGLSSIIHLLTGKSFTTTVQRQAGYGSSAYGR